MEPSVYINFTSVHRYPRGYTLQNAYDMHLFIMRHIAQLTAMWWHRSGPKLAHEKADDNKPLAEPK